MVASSVGERGWGRAERRRRWWSWVGVIVSSGGGVLLAGGRRDRTDHVGFERRAAMSSSVFGEGVVEGVLDSLLEGVVDSFVEVVVEL